MQQLTVFCSLDIEDRVVSALDRAGVEGFVRLPGGSAHLFAEAGQVPRTIAWEAVTLIVPTAPGAKLRQATAELEAYTRECETGVCLRYAVTEVSGALGARDPHTGD